MGKVQGPSQAGLQVSGARTQGKGGGPGPLGMSPQGVRPLGPPGSNSRHASSPRQGHDCLSQAWLHSGEAGDHGRLGQVHLEQAVQGPQACIPTVLEARVWAASGPGLSRRAGCRNLGAVLVAGAARGGSDGDRMRTAMQALKLAGTPHPCPQRVHSHPPEIAPSLISSLALLSGVPGHMAHTPSSGRWHASWLSVSTPGRKPLFPPLTSVSTPGRKPP